MPALVLEEIMKGIAAGTARKRSLISLQQVKRSKYLYMLFAIPFVYYVIFEYVPMYGILIAFKNYNVVRGIMGSPWVGLRHFESFLLDPYFWKLARNTLLISFYSLIWGFPVPIILALLFNEVRNKRFSKVIQNVSYLPHFISTVVICGMIVNFLSTDGLVQQIVRFFGGTPRPYLMFPEYFRTIYISSGIWQSMGWGSIIFLAALSTVDEELYEAAVIDGANRWHKIWHISLPSIAPTISILLILRMGSMLSVGYEKILLLYNGSTYETADVISTFVYRRGILRADFSYGTAIGLFNAVCNFILIWSANRISRMVSENSLW